MKNELLRTLQELKKKMQEVVIDFKDEDYILIIPTYKAISFMQEIDKNAIYTIEPNEETKYEIYGVEYNFDIYANNILLMNKEEYKKYGLIGLERG